MKISAQKGHIKDVKYTTKNTKINIHRNLKGISTTHILKGYYQ